jgi:hypothetical protein
VYSGLPAAGADTLSAWAIWRPLSLKLASYPPRPASRPFSTLARLGSDGWRLQLVVDGRARQFLKPWVFIEPSFTR